MNIYFGMVGRGPLVGKNMNVMSGLCQLMDIALHKLFGTSIKNKFLPDDGYFHGAGKPKGLRVRIVQDFLINGNSLVHQFINAKFLFAEVVSFFDHILSQFTVI